MTITEKLKTIYNALDDKKAIDIKIIDIKDISVLADYLVIAGGSNKSQVQAMVDSVEEELAKDKVYTNHVEGYSSANWILLDDRLFYDLERLWQDGNVVDVDSL